MDLYAIAFLGHIVWQFVHWKQRDSSMIAFFCSFTSTAAEGQTLSHKVHPLQVSSSTRSDFQGLLENNFCTTPKGQIKL